MRLTIAAVGRLKPGPLQDLYDDYVARLPWPVRLREVANGRGGTAAERQRREAVALTAALPAGARLVALDERGRSLPSRDFADRLARWRDADAEIAVLIGGADGLDPGLRERAGLVVAFGAATWPHFLVRVLLAEQLYRAHTLLSGHPYHRD